MPRRWSSPRAAEEVARDPQSLAECERAARREAVGERFPGEQLHGQERRALVIAEVEDLADVGMGDRGEQQRLATEPAERFGARNDCFSQNLDRHVAL